MGRASIPIAPGTRFGRLEVIGRAGADQWGNTRYDPYRPSTRREPQSSTKPSTH